MIKAGEAIRLANEYEDNYRKQERIALENKVSAEVEKAARQGKYQVIIPIDYRDKDYITKKAYLEGFNIGNVFKLSDNEHYSVEITWSPEETEKI